MELLKRKRYGAAVLCFAITMLCYYDRANIGIVVPSLFDSKQDQGLIMSAFFYGYLATQILGAFLAQKFGAKATLLGGVIVWVAFDALTLVSAKQLVWLFLTQFCMGLGQGTVFPCIHKLSAAWYPLQERSRLVAFVSSGMDIGTILSLLLSPAINAHWGWQQVFIVFGAFGLVWILSFAVWGAGSPEEHKTISLEEREFIVENRVVPDTTKPLCRHRHSTTPRSQSPHHLPRPEQPDDLEIAQPSVKEPTFAGYQQHQSPRNLSSSFAVELGASKAQSIAAGTQAETMNWRVLLTKRAAWAVYTAHFCCNYGWYVLLSWVSQYFQQELHIDLGKKGFSAAIPYVCGYLGVLLFGNVSNSLISRQFSVLFVRKLVNGISFFGAAIVLYCIHFTSNPNVAIVMLSMTLFLARASTSGYWVNMLDIAPNNAAHVMGVSNTIATIPGILGNIITGKILQKSGSWNLVFAIASGVLVFGGIVFQLFASDQDIYAEEDAASSVDEEDMELEAAAVDSRNEDDGRMRIHPGMMMTRIV